MLQRLFQRVDAGMDGRRISEFLKRFGSSEVLRVFLILYPEGARVCRNRFMTMVTHLLISRLD